MSGKLIPIDEAPRRRALVEEMIFKRFLAGEPIAEIAYDYDKSTDAIEDIIRRWARLQERRKRTVRVEG